MDFQSIEEELPSLSDLSPEAVIKVDCFLNPLDKTPHPEVLFGNKEAQDWVGKRIGFLKDNARETFLKRVPEEEFPYILALACGFIDYLFKKNSSPLIEELWSAKYLPLLDISSDLSYEFGVLRGGILAEAMERVIKELKVADEKYIPKLLEKLWLCGTRWITELVFRNDISNEVARNIVCHPSPFVRSAFAETKKVGSNYPLGIFYYLINDNSRMVYESAAASLESEYKGRFLPFLAIRGQSWKNWIIAPYRVEDQKTRNEELGQRSEFYTTSISSFLDKPTCFHFPQPFFLNKEAFLACGNFSVPKVKNILLKQFKGTLEGVPKIEGTNNVLENPTNGELSVEGFIGNKRFQYWINEQGEGLGWSQFEEFDKKMELFPTDFIGEETKLLTKSLEVMLRRLIVPGISL